MSLWKPLDWTELSTVPHLPGIYVIYADEDPRLVSYVGQSNNLFVRLRQHRPAWHPLSKIKYKLSTRTGEWLMWEYRLIERLKPPRNKTVPARYKTLAGRWKNLPLRPPDPNSRKLNKEQKAKRRKTRMTNQAAFQAKFKATWESWSEEKRAKFRELQQANQAKRKRR